MTTKPTAMQTAKRLIDRSTYGGGHVTESQSEVKKRFANANAMAVDARGLQEGIASSINDEHFAVLDGVRKVLFTVLDSFDGQPVKKEAIVYTLTLLNAMFPDIDWAGPPRLKTAPEIAYAAANGGTRTALNDLQILQIAQEARVKTLKQIANLLTLHERNSAEKLITAGAANAEAYGVYKGQAQVAKVFRAMVDSMIIDASNPVHTNGPMQQSSTPGQIAAAPASTGTEPAFKITIPK